MPTTGIDRRGWGTEPLVRLAGLGFALTLLLGMSAPPDEGWDLLVQADTDPTVTVDPEEGTPSSEVELSGENWIQFVVNGGDDLVPSPEEITVSFDNLPMDAAVEVDDGGILRGTAVIPDDVLGGVGEIVVCAEGFECASDFFTVDPIVAVTPEAGSPGTVVTVTGRGFQAVDPPREWQIRLGDDGVVIGSGLVGPAGTLEGTGTIPLDAPEESTTVSACRSDIDLGTICHAAPFVITLPTLRIEPSSVEPDETLQVAGDGWCCDGDRGTVLDRTGLTWGTVTVGEGGVLSGRATAPSDQEPGPVDLEVCVGDLCRLVQVEVLDPAVETTRVTTPTTAPPTTSPTTVTTVDGQEACALVPGSLTVDPQSGTAGTTLEITMTAAEDSADGCVLSPQMAGETIGQPFQLPPGAEVTATGVVPAGIAGGDTTVDLVNTDTGTVVASTVFALQLDGIAWEVVIPVAIVGALILAAMARFVRGRRPQPPSEPPPEPDRPAQPDEPAAPPPVATTVWPELRVPAAVEAGQTFSAEVRLRPDDGAALPDLVLDAELVADGYEATQGVRRQVRLGGTGPVTVPFDLAARPVEEAATHRIVAHLYRGGHLVGWAQADPQVFPAGTAPAEAGTAPAASVPLGTPDGPPPDLTLTISRGDDERYLVWGFGSPHPVTLPTGQVRSDLGKDNARAFAHDEVLGLAATDPELVGMQLRGVSMQIGGRIPAAAWTALHDVAPFASAAGRPPVLLVVSEETYVPWELAAVPDDLVIDPAAPALVGAQTIVGRWMPPDAADGLHPDHPVLPPPASLDVDSMAVVVHQEGAGQAPPLPYARDEADTLASTYGAFTVPAATGPVAGLLELRHRLEAGVAAPDVLHLTCHGAVEPDQPSRSGIVLMSSDGSWVPLTSSMVRGAALLPAARPLLFINACATGTPQEALDGFGGLAAAALKAGARGVVAPLWKVDDRAAYRAALEVYGDAFGDGAAVGDALRHVRAAATATEQIDRSYLAYVFFGHPWLRLTRAGADATPAEAETADLR